ncbi:MAG: DUF4191 domain-containing protein [Candidatus Nanopelagicales bacterium]
MSKIGQRFSNITTNYKLASKHDSKLGLILAAIFFGILALSVILGRAVNNLATALLIGIPVAMVATAFVFSRRAMRAAYKNIEGQPGAAVAVIQNMTKLGWFVIPMVAVNRHQDMVHRAVGKGGVVLVGEGKTSGLRALLATERKRTARFVGEAPLSEVVIGDEPGEVKIAELDKHLRRMPKVLAPGEVTELRRRLEAAMPQSAPPVPKGPLPTSGRQVKRGKMR